MARSDRKPKLFVKQIGGFIVVLSSFVSSTCGFALDETEKDCRMWQSHIKTGQILTKEMQLKEIQINVHIVPPNGAVIANYESGRRTIWMAPNNKVKYATCG